MRVRQVAALDIVVSVVIGSNLSRALTGDAPLVGTLAATTALLALHWLLAWSAARYPALSRLLEGRAVALSRGAGVDHRARLHHSVSRADIDEAVRGAGLAQEHEAARITLEPSGKITVLRR